MDESAKQTAQVLLDFYANAARAEGPDDEDKAFDDAFIGLEDAGAFTVEEDEDDEVALEITPLLIGTTVITQWLIGQLSEATDYTEEEILFDLRAFLRRLETE
ncbi:hypothetical protein [Demequina oxidasica]|uniref:hypothetical protein n=1 Tax=Demequina oxidasica TaxID=676199 RepID=UPI0007810AA1|nr:hypothetical protein [Demequina oxidasica]